MLWLLDDARFLEHSHGLNTTLRAAQTLLSSPFRIIVVSCHHALTPELGHALHADIGSAQASVRDLGMPQPVQIVDIGAPLFSGGTTEPFDVDGVPRVSVCSCVRVRPHASSRGELIVSGP